MSERKQPSVGKGDKPRTLNNKNWRDRYDEIDWGHFNKNRIINKDGNEEITWDEQAMLWPRPKYTKVVG